MRKEVPRDSAPNRTSRAVNKPSPSSGKGQKRAAAAAPSVGKSIKKKKPSAKSSEGESTKSSSSQSQQSDSKGKKKLLKPKVVLTKLNPGNLHQLAKAKPAKEAKKETCPKPVKSKPKKVIVSKPTKKIIKVENDSKRATAAKIVRAVKDVKKARSVVASKIAKTVPKKLSDSGNVRKISSSGINVVKKHNIVKSVNKMSGKKPCVVSVKISNAHSTVTLSVKQNKQIAKKDSTKGSKSSGGRITDRSTISIVKKGIASRRKSASKDCTSQESTPSQSPTRDTSPVRSKETKSSTKTTKSVRSENTKPQKKLIKQSSLENKKVLEEKGKDKQCESLKELEDHNQSDKTEVIINDTLKIKTENVGEDQNMEIEFTNSSEKDHSEDKDTKDNLSVHKDDVAKDLKSKIEEHLVETKAKSPLNEYSNLKSIDSTTSDEIPLEDLKLKQKTIKQEKDSECASQESTQSEKNKKGKESPISDATDNIPLCLREEANLGSSINLEKKKSEIEKPFKSARMSKTALKKVVDQESVAKLKISAKSKEKLKDLAVKQKVAKLVRKSRLTEQKQKKALVKEDSDKDPDGDSDQSRKRLKLYKFWNGPKRHRVASLNAIAKVHCLYENESRGALNDVISSAAALQRAIQESKRMARMENKDRREKKVIKKQAVEKKTSEPTNTRNLRTNPGIRSVGRNFDILNVISSTSLSSSSSSEESSDSGEDKKQLVLLPSVKQKQQQIIKEESEQTTDDEAVKKPQPTPNEESKDGVKKVKKRRRKRNELTMDLKDMVVRKRMASLNASAIMTASYSTEKKDKRKDEEQIKEKKERKKKKKPPVSSPVEESSADEDVIVRTTNNKQKVAVIVNQDTDVTITGVYVNSTTRSTHHEGYCSIAGMQYRISSTSHTQTEATAVATETVLHAEHPPCLPDAGPAQTVATTALSSPCKSYTPLSALSSMQPPGHHHPHPPPCQPPRGPPLSPLQRRHGCSSAFTAPPNYPPPTGPPPPPPPHPDVHGIQWLKMKGLRKLITVNQAEIDALAMKETLINDAVIEAYLRIVERRNWYHRVCLPSIYVFDTFFLKDWKEKRYRAVNGRFKKEDIFHYQMLLVPVHLPDHGTRGHWILIVVTVNDYTITVYDSCGGSNKEEGEAVRKFLLYEAERRDRPINTWKTVEAPRNIPRQENVYDCGAFVCMYAEVLSRKAPLEGKRVSGKAIRKNIASVLRARRVGVEDFRYIEAREVTDVLMPEVRGQTGLSKEEAAASFRMEANAPVRDPVLEDLLKEAELGYPSMRHINLFSPLRRPGPSLHPAPMDIDVEETTGSNDDLIALIDDAVRDLNTKPEDSRISDQEGDIQIDSGRPVSPCLSIAASDSWVMIGEKPFGERRSERDNSPEQRVNIEMEAEISPLFQLDTSRRGNDGETHNARTTGATKRKKRHPKRIRIYSEDGTFKRVNVKYLQ